MQIIRVTKVLPSRFSYFWIGIIYNKGIFKRHCHLLIQCFPENTKIIWDVDFIRVIRTTYFFLRWFKSTKILSKSFKGAVLNFSSRYIFSYKKDDILHRKLRICSHLQKKSLIENIIFCAVMHPPTWDLSSYLNGGAYPSIIKCDCGKEEWSFVSNTIRKSVLFFIMLDSILLNLLMFTCPIYNFKRIILPLNFSGL